MSERGLSYLQTPLALLDRVRKNGGKEIRKVMSDWKFWIPTKKGQVTRLCVVAKHTLGQKSLHLSPCCFAAILTFSEFSATCVDAAEHTARRSFHLQGRDLRLAVL